MRDSVYSLQIEIQRVKEKKLEDECKCTQKPDKKTR
jgi:hypothetical protein